MNNLEEGVWYHKEPEYNLKTALNLTDSYYKKTVFGKYIHVNMYEDYVGIDYMSGGFGLAETCKPATEAQIKRLQERLEGIV